MKERKIHLVDVPEVTLCQRAIKTGVQAVDHYQSDKPERWYCGICMALRNAATDRPWQEGEYQHIPRLG